MQKKKGLHVIIAVGLPKPKKKKNNPGRKRTKGQKKIAKTMKEFATGEMHSGTKKGPVVTNKKQATAIALSKARKVGAKIPKKKSIKKKK